MQGSTRIDELRQKFHENPRRYFAPLANEYRKAGDPEQAIAICRAHLAQQPGHMSGHVVYAQALYDAGRIDESRVVFEKALSLDPDNAIVLRQLGDISRQRGDSAEARHWYSRALETDPHDREVAAYIAELTEPLTETDATPETEPSAVEEPVAETAVAEQPVEVQPVEVQPVESEPVQVEMAGANPESREADGPTETTPLARELADEAHDFASSPTDIEVPLAAPEREPEVTEREPEVTEREPEVTEQEPEVTEQEPEVPEQEPEVPEQEPEVPEQELEVPEPAGEGSTEADDGAVIAPPLSSASPFVTRTMADLYARQGYHEHALDVYRELAAANPDDAELADRIRELSVVSEAPVSALGLADSVSSDQPSAEAGVTDPENVNEFSEPVDLEVELGFPSQDEVAAPATDSEMPSQSRHFTEGDLAEGDQWDTDPWGAGFSSDDAGMVPFAFSPSNATQNSADAFNLEDPPGLEETGSPIAESDSEAEDLVGLAEAVPYHGAPDEAETLSTEVFSFADATGPFAAIEVEELAAEPEASATAESAEEDSQAPELELSSTSIPLGVLNEAREEISVEEMFQLSTGSPASDDEEASPASDEVVVAYSPQTPDEKDLPHYTQTGPTIREFFATLGAYRPPGLGEQPSFTARAMVPEITMAEPDESDADEIWNPAAPEPADKPAREPDAFPLASDAFASLFPDSPVSDEDSKAAFALSGALSSQPVAMPRPTPPKPVAPSVSEQPAPATGAQESEEDIRRFREWLDGLADS